MDFEEMNEEELEFPENDPVMDMLCEAVRNVAPRASVLNAKRYQELLAAKKLLDPILEAMPGGQESSIRFYPLFSSASLSASADSFEVCDLETFRTILELADNIEVAPLLDDRVSMGLMFHHVMIPME